MSSKMSNRRTIEILPGLSQNLLQPSCVSHVADEKWDPETRRCLRSRTGGRRILAPLPDFPKVMQPAWQVTVGYREPPTLNPVGIPCSIFEHRSDHTLSGLLLLGDFSILSSCKFWKMSGTRVVCPDLTWPSDIYAKKIGVTLFGFFNLVQLQGFPLITRLSTHRCPK